MVHHSSIRPHEDGLEDFAQRICSNNADPDALSKLEKILAPMVRLALRRGAGIPALVQWVRRAHAELAGNRPAHFDQFTTEIACLLARFLVRPRMGRSVVEDTFRM